MKMGTCALFFNWSCRYTTEHVEVSAPPPLGRPHYYMCRFALSSTNKCGIDHADLSLYKQLPCLLRASSQCLHDHHTNWERECLCSRLSTPSALASTFTRPSSLPPSHPPIAETSQPTKQNAFPPLHEDLRSFAQWLSDHQCVDVCMESTGIVRNYGITAQC